MKVHRDFMLYKEEKKWTCESIQPLATQSTKKQECEATFTVKTYEGKPRDTMSTS